MSKEDWFDSHVIIDLGGFNNKDDKNKAEETLKNKLKVLTAKEMKKLEEEFKNDSKRDD